MTEYDIGGAFKAIEDELMKSMIRNMDRHRAEETREGIEWSMWQAEQLKALEKYKRDNQKRYGKQFQNLNKEMGELIQIARQRGNMQQEIQILDAIRKGFPTKKISKGAMAEFFRLNDRKLEALIQATTNDMERAETAILRMANDRYRKAIFNAQVYANSGSGTYEKAVDMATKDMLASGLNCIEYKNGARHTLADYADMAIRTASKRAYLHGEGEKRREWGITTVIVNKRGNPCPKCLPFVGKVLIDDVWSGGTADDGSYPLMSSAIEAGLYHPRCKDSHTTYFPGISTADDTWTQKELKAIGQDYKREQQQQYAARQAERYGRLSAHALDDENQKRYAARREEWKKQRAGKPIPETETVPSNNGNQIVYDFKGKDGKFEQSRKLIEQLSGEYNSRLKMVTVGAHYAAGDVGDYGTLMRLSSNAPEVTVHEFAHSLADQRSEKLGLSNNKDFWKEIKAVRRKYRKDVGDDSSRWISAYEHSSKSHGEFFAEAFAQAKMREMGLEIPPEYGIDFTYSQQVLDITNKHFGKAVAKTPGPAIIKSGARITDLFSKEADDFAKMYYAEIRGFSTDTKKIAQNLGKSEVEIQRIKEYLFEADSLIDLDTGTRRHFDPDCAIAQSWQRLMIGKDIKPHDRTLIEHELLEMEIKKKNPRISHQRTHELASQKYNYSKEASEYYGNLKKHKENPE